MRFESKQFSELTAEELYEILKSRNEIFVIEQECIFQDCDDRDYGYHVFCRDDSGRVTAYMPSLSGASGAAPSCSRPVARLTGP